MQPPLVAELLYGVKPTKKATDVPESRTLEGRGLASDRSGTEGGMSSDAKAGRIAIFFDAGLQIYGTFHERQLAVSKEASMKLKVGSVPLAITYVLVRACLEPPDC